MPVRKASRACATSSAPAEGSRPAATCSAPARPESAIERAASGSPASAGSMALWYCDSTRLPRTATPSAPPSSRVVSFMAEPTPAREGGTADMIEPVKGAMVRAMPPEIISIGITTTT